jgi:quercetin 2,3-dioxygenase
VTDALTDPFLMLDELGPKEYAKSEFEGAPWHPHRGFDTVMYLRAGEGRHQDSMGNSGIVRAGEVQWMSAASGVIHDEGREHPGGLLHGFQMWVNLPAKHKMDPPQYQQLTADTFQWVPFGTNSRIKVIAGEVPGIAKSPFSLRVPILYADVEAGGGAEGYVPVPEEMQTAMVYVYDGDGSVFNGSTDAGHATTVRRKDTVLYAESGGGISFTTPKDGAGVKFLVMCGKRIGEPVARMGPFVMNTQDELQRAVRDYHEGKLATVKGEVRTF